MDERPEEEERLWGFIYFVQARGLEDVVLHEPEEFVRLWTSTDFQTYESWKHLDAYCRLREDLDLSWVPILIGTTTCTAPPFLVRKRAHCECLFLRVDGVCVEEWAGNLQSLGMGGCQEAVTSLTRDRWKMLDPLENFGGHPTGAHAVGWGVADDTDRRRVSDIGCQVDILLFLVETADTTRDTRSRALGSPAERSEKDVVDVAERTPQEGGARLPLYVPKRLVLDLAEKTPRDGGKRHPPPVTQKGVADVAEGTPTGLRTLPTVW